MPAFHCLFPVRDEADIISQSIKHMLEWSDFIYILDTGSVDETWEIILDLASKEKRIKPLKKDHVYFSDNAPRGWLFNQARPNMKSGDWFLRVDADEFYDIYPPEFVKTRLKPYETCVWYQIYNFVLTESELLDWDSGKETLLDRSKPIELRRQWFIPDFYTEPRLCRYRDSMKWPNAVSFPYNAGFVARERIPMRHYPHRDPVQLMRRCRLRAVMMADKENRSHWTQAEHHHWTKPDWKRYITPDNAVGIGRWQPGNQLPELKYTNHLGKSYMRFLQLLAHSMLLPILDKNRIAWLPNDYPKKLPIEVIEQLKKELSF